MYKDVQHNSDTQSTACNEYFIIMTKITNTNNFYMSHIRKYHIQCDISSGNFCLCEWFLTRRNFFSITCRTNCTCTCAFQAIYSMGPFNEPSGPLPCLQYTDCREQVLIIGQVQLQCIRMTKTSVHTMLKASRMLTSTSSYCCLYEKHLKINKYCYIHTNTLNLGAIQ
jgi:hypothetical protein